VQVELHRHLDVSVRAATLLELAQKRGIESQSTSLEAFRDKLILRKPLTDLTEVLAQFTLFQDVLDRPDILDRITYECVEDCRSEGTRLVELRFSPTFLCEKSKLPWRDALHGIWTGLERARAAFPDMQVGLLCIASRDYGVDDCARTVEFFLENQAQLAGLDLAGNEINFPCRLFETAFQKAARAGAKITVHAGEAAGPENVWEAIDLLGARRIGHGIASIRDPQLMKELAARSICLEMCPTSNWLTRAVANLADHPLPKVLRAGVPVCINTDDPGIFGVTMPHEIEICRKQMRMSDAEILQCADHARRSSFLSNKIQQY